MPPSLVAEPSAEPVSKLIQDISQKEFPMRVIFETARLFALVAVFGLMAASSGCAKPEGGADAPPSDLGAEAGSTTGGGAEIPEGGSEEPAEGGDAAPAEGDAAPAEGEAAAPAEGDAAPAEGEAAAPAEGE